MSFFPAASSTILGLALAGAAIANAAEPAAPAGRQCELGLGQLGDARHDDGPGAGAAPFNALAVPGEVTVAAVVAPWCASCERLKPTFSKLREREGVTVTTIQFDAAAAKEEMGPNAALPYTVIFDRKAQRVERFTTYDPAGILAAVDALE